MHRGVAEAVDPSCARAVGARERPRDGATHHDGAQTELPDGVLEIRSRFRERGERPEIIEPSLEQSVLLLDHAGWQWIFVINVPIAFLAALAVTLLVPESRSSNRPAID